MAQGHKPNPIGISSLHCFTSLAYSESMSPNVLECISFSTSLEEEQQDEDEDDEDEEKEDCSSSSSTLFESLKSSRVFT